MFRHAYIYFYVRRNKKLRQVEQEENHGHNMTSEKHL